MSFQTTFTRGESFSLALEATDGDIAGATCRADLKLTINGEFPPESAAPLMAFSVTAVDEVTPGGNPGWLLSLSPDQTGTLPTGNYVTDAKIIMANGWVEQTDPVTIHVKKRVTV